MAKIFGFNVSIRRDRPSMLAGTNFAARTALATVAASETPDAQARITPKLAELPFFKANQELPVTFPKRQPDGVGLPNRRVASSPFDDWFLAIAQKIPPKQVESILRMASSGNLWNQYQLNRRMEESWPMYKKCVLELKRRVASVKYVAHPFTLPGKRPTASAQQKADLANRSLNGMQPDRFSDEEGLYGTVFDLCDAIPMGVSITEMLWNEDTFSPDGEPEILPRATAWVNPRNLAFTPDGRIGVANAAESGNLSFGNLVRQELMDDPDKFLVAKLKSKSGSPLTAGLMRTLADIWTIVVYGRDYARLYMQKYGNPFLTIAYEVGVTDQRTIDRLEQLAQLAAAQGYLVYPTTGDSTKVDVKPAEKMGADNAQLAMMKIADEACQLLLLGQTLTTNVGDSGSRALGDVHNDVRNEIIEHTAKWMATILTEQFVDSVMRVNYGDDYLRNPERPTVEADMTRPMSATEQADYIQKISNSTVPLIADAEYKTMGKEMPQPGDTALVRGEIVIVEEAVTPTEKRQKQFDEQLAQQLEVSQATGELTPTPAMTDKNIQSALKTANQDDLKELESLVAAAESAPHQNGELALVTGKVRSILNKSRR